MNQSKEIEIVHDKKTLTIDIDDYKLNTLNNILNNIYKQPWDREKIDFLVINIEEHIPIISKEKEGVYYTTKLKILMENIDKFFLYKKYPNIILNFENTDYFHDFHALSILINWESLCNKRKSEFCLAGVKGSVKYILVNLVKLSDCLNMYDDIESAIEAT